MLSRSGRPLATVIFGPVAKAFVKMGISPNAVTITGGVLSSVAALALFPAGYLLLGALIVTILVIFDNLDGQMARLTGKTTKFGAFLDSTMDRVSDGAIFAALAMWGYLQADDAVKLATVTGAIAAAVVGAIVPYARARAEGVGYSASVGLAERADRLIFALILVLAVGFGAPHAVMAVGLWLLAVAALFTVGQRVVYVYTQMKKAGDA
ncbi:phosphatidylinositol phosphate synthase [Trueperella pecoris]|uniref:Phosphatidylinositol phosphate synthase n=1 Tax=Trueperella pecoris TaxID=2733571 RepID=A0A7M1QXC9_9ACTO|nr:CDP-alcohol phosphatidyltransferase family protein [Trueperella pecoris]QOQ38893.1 CDP-alcohol phosphatidyltransferase family protein [Trueperella pecoris]QOR46481.1 CDP-alcohol phosphatidyltransferase family protein [Trueperella pecoris]QTG76307.1 CDP-alcohol phosphatidyltransferase family protein [Trueperella pecoris]